MFIFLGFGVLGFGVQRSEIGCQGVEIRPRTSDLGPRVFLEPGEEVLGVLFEAVLISGGERDDVRAVIGKGLVVSDR